MNFAYQGRHAPAKLASMAVRSMVASSSANQNQNWLTDTSAFDHITSDLSQLSLAQQPAAGEFVTVGNGQDLPVTHIGNGFTYEEGALQRAELGWSLPYTCLYLSAFLFLFSCHFWWFCCPFSTESTLEQ